MDLYSLCPGGTGKKIKFCCSDLLGDLQKIDRMIEGQQYAACLKHVERLEEANLDRACLLATKALLLRLLQRPDEAAVVAASFREKHPDNPIALAESAISATIGGDVRAGAELLSRAIAASGDVFQGRVYGTIRLVAKALVRTGQIIAAKSHCLLLLAIQPDDETARELLVSLHSAPELPVLLKEDRAMTPCPDGWPAKEAFDEALALVYRGCWLDAAERFGTLAEQFPDQPAVWHNLAIVRGNLADTPGSIEAWHAYAALDVPLEDAAEAETLARLLGDDPFGDLLDAVSLTYPVDDADALESSLAASPWTSQLPPHEIEPRDDGPRPKSAFYLLDRRQVPADQPEGAKPVLPVLCVVQLFDRQTDQPARLVVHSAVATDVDTVKTLVAELAAGQCNDQPLEEVIGNISATRALLAPLWHLPADKDQDAFHEVAFTHLERSLLEVWPDRPLGLLDGKSPAQAAAEPDAYRVKLMAAMMLVGLLLEEIEADFDVNRLRSRLGLPELGPIDPVETPLERLPLMRLARVEAEKLSDEALLKGFIRAVTCSVPQALAHFAHAVVERPGLAGRKELLHAYHVLAELADDDEEALRWVGEGRQATLAAGHSCAPWDLSELRLQFSRRDMTEVRRLLDHLHTRHAKEPNVAEAITDVLIDYGLLQPDGTPWPHRTAQAGEAAPGIVVPGQEDAESGKLWTPESETPVGQKGKLWTPGS